MRALLDTHALIWSLSAPKRLSKKARTLLEDDSNQVYVSAASTWEIAIKAALGRIEVDLPALAGAITGTGFDELRVSIAHTLRVRELPLHHRDPFDRLLVAQALEEGLTLVTDDPEIHKYRVATVWH